MRYIALLIVALLVSSWLLQLIYKEVEVVEITKYITVNHTWMPTKPPCVADYPSCLPAVLLAFDSTCAVVGGSDGLLNSRCGSFINSHDLVFRFNTQPTRGFEEDVGSRTDVRWVYPESYFSEPSDAFIMFTFFKEKDLSYANEIVEGKKTLSTSGFWKAVPSKPLHPPGRHILLKYEYRTELETRWNSPYRLTTGTLGILLAIERCKSVSVFGFSSGVNYKHYYPVPNDNARVNADGTMNYHNMTFERSFRKKLENKNLIKEYTGKCATNT